MNKKVKVILAGISAVLGISIIKEIIKENRRNSIEEVLSNPIGCVDCAKCSRNTTQCENAEYFILNFEECTNNVPISISAMVADIQDSKDPIRYSCLVYLQYDFDEDIMTCYHVKAGKLVYIKFDMDNKGYKYSTKRSKL